MSGGPIILLAEDSEDDIKLLRIAMSQALLDSPLYVVRDGEEAIEYLKGEAQFSDRSKYPLPDLLLLDLSMPCKNGFEVLQWVRGQPSLKALCVVVLTSSQSIQDMRTAYLLGASSFLLKPLNFKDLFQLSHFLPTRFLLPDRPEDNPPPSSINLGSTPPPSPSPPSA